MTSSKDVTQLLIDWGNGDRAALSQLMPLVYGELHKLADRYLRREHPNHTIQATALVHEAYLRLIDQHLVQWQNRAHFFGVAAQMMRRILVNYALAQQADKRGGNRYKVSLNENMAMMEIKRDKDMEVVALDDALNRLAEMDERKSRLIELRFFGGLTMEETAEVLGISLATAKRDWSMARAWLYREVRKEGSVS
jgi:RNA polymerase sigma factor (TIGR02999 family)